MVLVTGATGLVGSHLSLHLLEKGEAVLATYRNPKSLSKTKALFQSYGKVKLFDALNWIQADIIDISAMELVFQQPIDEVYHCAALISFDPKDEEQLRKSNIEGTANIVNFCLTYKVKKLCYVSSIAALGNLKENETVLTEQSEWNPESNHSDYAISKYGAEMEIWRGQQEGLKVVLVNPGVILGFGFFEQASGVLFAKIKNGFPFYTTGSTGFVSVWDVVKIMYLVMKSDINGERFSVISENCTFKEVLFNVAENYGVSKPKFEISKSTTLFLSKLDWFWSIFCFQKRTLSRELALSLHAKELVSNAKIVEKLDYSFEPVSETIRYIISLEKQLG